MNLSGGKHHHYFIKDDIILRWTGLETKAFVNDAGLTNIVLLPVRTIYCESITELCLETGGKLWSPESIKK